ncbi:hypothetical protein MRX96_001380 [Rhipicephalus microplus]
MVRGAHSSQLLSRVDESVVNHGGDLANVAGASRKRRGRTTRSLGMAAPRTMLRPRVPFPFCLRRSRFAWSRLEVTPVCALSSSRGVALGGRSTSI